MRDPRLDPIAGDVLIIGPQWQSERYEVLTSPAGKVRYQLGPMRAVLETDIKRWREWAKGAEIVSRGKE